MIRNGNTSIGSPEFNTSQSSPELANLKSQGSPLRLVVNLICSDERHHVDELHIPLPLLRKWNSRNARRIGANTPLGQSCARRSPSARHDELIRRRLPIDHGSNANRSTSPHRVWIVERNQLGRIA